MNTSKLSQAEIIKLEEDNTAKTDLINSLPEWREWGKEGNRNYEAWSTVIKENSKQLIRNLLDPKGVLVLEDEQMYQNRYKEDATVLELPNDRFHITADLESALNVLEEYEIGLVISDLKVPERKGVKADWKVGMGLIYKAQEKRIPVVAATSQEIEEVTKVNKGRFPHGDLQKIYIEMKQFS